MLKLFTTEEVPQYLSVVVAQAPTNQNRLYTNCQGSADDNTN